MESDHSAMQEDRIKNIWGNRTPYFSEWPIRSDKFVMDEPDEWIQSACVMCSNGCGLDIGVKNGRIVGVKCPMKNFHSG